MNAIHKRKLGREGVQRKDYTGSVIGKMNQKLEAEIDKEKKRHEAAILAIMTTHKRELDELEDKECTICFKKSKKYENAKKLKVTNKDDSDDGGDDDADDDDDDDDDDECYEWETCTACSKHVCKECVQECEDCYELYCGDCATHGTKVIGTNKEVQTCEHCHEDGFFCCKEVSEVDCGMRVCDDCKEEHHKGYECNGCYQASKGY